MLEGLKELKFYKRGHELIAYDGEHYYKVEPCKYMDSKTSYVTDGFQFIPIKEGEMSHD